MGCLWDQYKQSTERNRGPKPDSRRLVILRVHESDTEVPQALFMRYQSYTLGSSWSLGRPTITCKTICVG